MTRDCDSGSAAGASGGAGTRLARKLNTLDAVVVGLGAMLGAGIFTALAPAAGAAGEGLAIALVVAGFVAYCNATSSAALAALYPESGGAYVYGRKRLGHFAGFLAGWGFVVGKLAVYALVALTALTALAAVGAAGLSRTPAPLVAVVEGSRWPGLAGLVRVGAGIASLGVLLSLLAGVSRTAFAMAANGDLPRGLATVHSRFRVPHHAELAAGAIIVCIVLVADVGDAIGFSAFTVLVYYAIANASALTLERHERRWPRALAAAGLAGCALLAASLPIATVMRGTAVTVAGALVYAILRVAQRFATKRERRSGR